MLIATTDERWTQTERIDFFLKGLMAVDPETGAEMYVSGGRRMTGRGARYTCTVPSGETRMGYLNTDTPRPIPVNRKAFTVTAHYTAAAIEQANKALTKFIAKGPHWNSEDYTWIFEKAGK